MAALRRRGPRRPGGRLPQGCGRAGAAGLAGAKTRSAGRGPGADPGGSRRRDPRRGAGAGLPRRRPHPGPPRLSDLHLGLDRRAEGHRHQPRQHLPFPAVRERPLRDARRRRRLSGRLGGLRSLDGGDLGSVSRRREPVRGEPGHDGRRGGAARHPGGGADHGARHRADPAGDDLRRSADGAPRPARRRGPARAAGRPLGHRRAPAVQHLRPDRGHRGGDGGRDAARRAGHDRRPDPELLGLRRRGGSRACSAATSRANC